MKRMMVVLFVAVLGLSAAHGQSADQKKATVAYLQKLQTAEGGFRPSAAAEVTKPSLRATSSGLRALKYFGGEARDRRSAAAFVAGCFDRTSGGFADTPGGKPDVVTTAVGLMAVVELKMAPEPYVGPAVAYLAEHAKNFEEIRIAAAGLEAAHKRPPVADTWLKEVTRMRRTDGGFGDGSARDSGGAAVVVLRLGGELERRADLLKVIRAGQNADGGFGKTGAKGPDLETTYRVMRCFMMLKEKPKDADALRGFVARCRNGDGGYGVAPGQPSTVSGTYFAGIVLHWLDAR